MKWKIFTAVLLLLLIITNVFWLYSSIDRGVTSAYHDDVTYNFANQIKDLTKLCNHFIIGMPADSFKKIFATQFKLNDVCQTDSSINTTWISILISNNKVIGIKDDDLLEEWSKKW